MVAGSTFLQSCKYPSAVAACELAVFASRISYNFAMFDEDFYQYLFNRVDEGIYTVDPQRRILDWNSGAEAISGYTRERVVGQFCMANILQHVDEHGNQLCYNGCPLAETLRDRQERTAQVFLHHADGHRVQVNIKTIPVIKDDVVIGAAEIFHEVTPMQDVLARVEVLQQAVTIDELTGLRNRRKIQSELETSLRHWQSVQAPFGVLWIDIDCFKQINDRYGHAVGDRVLQMVSRSLGYGLRRLDQVGRWGGEEFLAIIHCADKDGLRRAGERLRMLVENSQFVLEDPPADEPAQVGASVSVGGAMIRPDDTLNSLLERGDRALYHAKSSGRNRVVVE